MILQIRDKKLLGLLSQYGVLSTEQITKLCFEKIAHSTVMRRIRMLEKENLILRLSGLPNAMNAWCLTTKGAEKISCDNPFRYSNRNTLHHEVTLSEVRLSLKTIDLGESWTTEMELRRKMQWTPSQREKHPLIPDGIFIAQQDEKPNVASVELELTPKNHARYRNLFEQYRYKNAIDFVWYIVATSAIGDTVLDQWSRVHHFENSPTLLVSLLSEIIKNPSEAQVFTPDHDAAKVSGWFDIKPMLT